MRQAESEDPNQAVKRALDTAHAAITRVGATDEAVAGLLIMRGILMLAKSDNLAALMLQREVIDEWIEMVRSERPELH